MNLNNVYIVIVGFVVAFVISLLGGFYLPKNVGLIGPIIGGLIAGYMIGGSYTDGILYGGIPTSVAGFISTPLLILLLKNQIDTVMTTLNYNMSLEALTPILVIGGAISGLILFFLIGMISGIIGVAIKKRTTN